MAPPQKNLNTDHRGWLKDVSTLEETSYKKEKKESRFFKDIAISLKEMPSTMKKLGIIQFFSWFLILNLEKELYSKYFPTL